MTGEPTGGMLLVVAGDLRLVRGLVTEFFDARGWRVHERGPGELTVETGSRRRTVLLGALAGRGFHLSAPVGLREVPGAVEVHYRWGAEAGRTLGGSFGRARAVRVHRETAAALEGRLEHAGLLVQVRPL